MSALIWGLALVRSVFGGLSLKAWILGAALAVFALWSLYLINLGHSWADAAWRAKQLEATIAQLKADLTANEVIKRQAEADARAAEDEERRLKEVIDALKAHKSCPLSDEHVDGLHKIDAAP
jgi:hypothetical protein